MDEIHVTQNIEITSYGLFWKAQQSGYFLDIYLVVYLDIYLDISCVIFYCLKNFTLSISEFDSAYLDICRDTFLSGTWMVKFLFRGPLCHQCSFQNESINVEWRDGATFSFSINRYK